MGGVWTREDEGLVHIGSGSTYTAGTTGGEKTHTLTVDEMPSHSHKDGWSANGAAGTATSAFGGVQLSAVYAQGYDSDNTGGNQPHNNMQPYVVVNRWHRTA